MNSVIADVIRSGGAALLALHELAPARGMLDRTLVLAEGRIATAQPDRAIREDAELVPL
jgi:ABC-type hemin transport system ATPase subunit